jgi:micrococcal nuclease
VKRPPRPYWNEHRGAAVWLVILVLLFWRAYQARSLAAPEKLEEGVHQVRRVIDGDTLQLTSGARIRLQGVNTPETVMPDHPVEAWGPEASQFTKDFVEKTNHTVRLTFSLERKDKYDRFLAFVWNSDGSLMLNEELVRSGLAYARRDYRYSSTMKRRFTQAQDDAKRAGRGIWSNTVAINADSP